MSPRAVAAPLLISAVAAALLTFVLYSLCIVSAASTASLDFDPAARIALVQPGLSAVYRASLAAAIRGAAKESGLDARLLTAVVEAESSYRPGLISSARAVGPAGIMPHWIGHTPYASTYEELREAPVNVYVGAWVLKVYIVQCGSVMDGLACYNAGPEHRAAGREYAKAVILLAEKLRGVNHDNVR